MAMLLQSRRRLLLLLALSHRGGRNGLLRFQRRSNRSNKILYLIGLRLTTPALLHVAILTKLHWDSAPFRC